jgi:hypothetical protein
MGERQPRANVFAMRTGNSAGSSSCVVYFKTGVSNCCEVEVSPFAVLGQMPLSLTGTQPVTADTAKDLPTERLACSLLYPTTH